MTSKEPLKYTKADCWGRRDGLTHPAQSATRPSYVNAAKDQDDAQTLFTFVNCSWHTEKMKNKYIASRSNHQKIEKSPQKPALVSQKHGKQLHKRLALCVLLCFFLFKRFGHPGSCTALLSPPFRSSPQVTREPSDRTAAKAQVAAESWQTPCSCSWRKC